MNFHNREVVLLVLAVGGVLAFAKDIASGIGVMYRFALTPQGLAATAVATLLLSVASLAVTLIRKS